MLRCTVLEWRLQIFIVCYARHQRMCIAYSNGRLWPPVRMNLAGSARRATQNSGQMSWLD
jgi:hypothetical protein